MLKPKTRVRYKTGTKNVANKKLNYFVATYQKYLKRCYQALCFDGIGRF